MKVHLLIDPTHGVSTNRCEGHVLQFWRQTVGQDAVLGEMKRLSAFCPTKLASPRSNLC